MNSQDPTVVLSLTVSDVIAALDFYAKAFDAKEVARMTMPDGTLVHAEVMIGNSLFYVSIGSEEWKAVPLAQGSLAPCLFAVSVDEVDGAFEKVLSAGGTKIEGPQDQFWGMRTAVISDPFGYRWVVRKMTEELSPDEVMKRAAEMMAGGK